MAPGARTGIVGALPSSAKKEIEHWEEDYAVRMKEEIIRIIRNFCTPLRQEVDERLFQHFCRITRGFLADGALLKTGHVLQAAWFPNMVFILRDIAHTVRPACAEPLNNTGSFEEQYKRLFTGPDAVLAKLQHSTLWQSQLAAIEQRIVQVDGQMGGGLTHILRHMSFVQPRFESFVGPRRKYVCLLVAIAYLLSIKAGDLRLEKAVRDRSEKALLAMTAADNFAAGLAADFAETCLEFLRIFDCHDPNPARLRSHVIDFIEQVDTLFVKGHILRDVTSCSDADPNCGQSLVSIALAQSREQRVFSYGGKEFVMWGGTTVFDCKEHLKAAASAGKDVIKRLQAEFHDEDFIVCTQAMDLRSWEAVYQRADASSHSDPQFHCALSIALLRKARILCEMLRVPYDRAAWASAVDVALARRRSLLTLRVASDMDDRIIWRLVVDEPLVTPFRDVVAFFLSCWISTGSVERGLGVDADIMDNHIGGAANELETANVYSCLTEIRLEAPDTEEALFQRGPADILLFTDLSRLWAQLWVAVKGRRFRTLFCYCAMAVPWRCHAAAMAVPWRCMAVPWRHCGAKVVPWRCRGGALAVP